MRLIIKRINLLLVIGILLLLIVILSALKNIAYVSEYIFARGVSRIIITVMGGISGIFPFLVYEVLAIVGIGVVVFTIVRCVLYAKYKRYYGIYRAVAKLMVAVLSVILLYTASASFSYYRQPVENYLPQYVYEASKEQLISFAGYYVEDLNAISQRLKRDKDGNVVMPYSYDELTKRMQNEFSRLTDGYFNKINIAPKRMMTSRIFAFFDIAGVSFQPTGEAGVNYLTPTIDLPFLMAHEMAHTKGAMYESDAELLALFITLTSDDDYIRYSGYARYYYAPASILYLNGLDNDAVFAEYTGKLDKAFLKEKTNAWDYYSKHYGKFEVIGQYINDLYLRLSGAKDGVGSYFDDYDVIETPIIDDDGQQIDVERTIYYSNVQKLFFALYPNK